MRFAPAIVIGVLLGLCLTGIPQAAVDLSRDLERLQKLREQVDVEADRIEYAEGERRIVASGKVRIVVGERSLFADEVSVDLDDQVLYASGNVILMEGFNRLEGERIEYNYRTNQGVIVNGRALLDSGVSFHGVEIRREGERQYRLKDGRFTACAACQAPDAKPDWEFRAQEATVYQDEWITSRNVSFWVKGVPGLYAPYLALPIGPRRTGFLIPRVGYGNSDGFMISQPFFWAISRSQDATLTGIYRSKRGFELDGQYRYVLGERARGELSGRYLYDLESGDEPPNRGEAKWVHDQVLSSTWTFKADAAYQSDPNLNRDFIDTPSAQRTQRVLDSNVFLTQTTNRYMLLGLLGVTQDLSGSDNWFLRLPELRFQWLPGPVLPSLPLLAEAETSAVYFLRTEAADAGRLDVFPALHLPLTPFPWLTSTTSVGVRETAYTTAGPPGGATNRLLADLGQRFSSAFLRRFEQPGFGFSRLTHVVESGLQYQYVPWTDQQSLPQFDRVDFINPQNRLTYRVANRLMGRTEPARGEIQTFEVASLVVAQSLNLQPKTREFSNLYLEGLTPERVDQAVTDLRPLENGFTRASERRWSNLVIQAGFRPLPRLAVQGTVALNVEHPEVEGINSGLELQLSDTLTISAGQSYLRDQQVDGVVAKILWKATQNVALDLLTRYDIRTSVLLENTAILRYSSCCWEVALKYTHRTRGPGQSDENSVQVNFDLKVPTPAVAR